MDENYSCKNKNKLGLVNAKSHISRSRVDKLIIPVGT
jgi:hypothetical protein